MVLCMKEVGLLASTNKPSSSSQSGLKMRIQASSESAMGGSSVSYNMSLDDERNW